jgi:hypothetical protein
MLRVINFKNAFHRNDYKRICLRLSGNYRVLPYFVVPIVIHIAAMTRKEKYYD